MVQRIEFAPFTSGSTIRSTIRLLDATEQTSPSDRLLPFAYEEVLGWEVGSGGLPLIHLWRHQRTFVLGLRDRKLPHAKEAIAWLSSLGYEVIVRHSGGAAVPLDEGVVNLSFIIPQFGHHIDFKQDFAMMAAFIQQCLQPWHRGVQIGEIAGSYCPGDFDLSIDGRKFCGISQRRQTRAAIIQAFINVTGHGEERARLVQRFYDMATGDNGAGRAHRDRLSIRSDAMASLSQLTELQSVDEWIAAIKQTAASLYEEVLLVKGYDGPMMLQVEQMMETLRQRYDR